MMSTDLAAGEKPVSNAKIEMLPESIYTDVNTGKINTSAESAHRPYIVSTAGIGINV